MAQAQAIGADRVELYTEPYAQAWGTAAQAQVAGRISRRRRSGAGARPRRQCRPRPQPRQPRRLPRRRPGVLEVSIGHAFVADALELGMAETVRAYRRVIDRVASTSARRRADDLRHRHRPLRRAPHPRRAGAPRRPLRRARARPARDRGLPRPPRPARGARRALPGDALLGQGGVLEGDRPRHAHADDLARLRDRQAAERQARDPPARRARRLVRDARPARPRQRHRRGRLRGELRRRRTGTAR